MLTRSVLPTITEISRDFISLQMRSYKNSLILVDEAQNFIDVENRKSTFCEKWIYLNPHLFLSPIEEISPTSPSIHFKETLLEAHLVEAPETEVRITSLNPLDLE